MLKSVRGRFLRVRVHPRNILERPRTGVSLHTKHTQTRANTRKLTQTHRKRTQTHANARKLTQTHRKRTQTRANTRKHTQTHANTPQTHANTRKLTQTHRKRTQTQTANTRKHSPIAKTAIPVQQIIERRQKKKIFINFTHRAYHLKKTYNFRNTIQVTLS